MKNITFYITILALLSAYSPPQITGNNKAVTHFKEVYNQVEIPILPISDYTILEAVINGQSGFRMLIDTGSPVTVFFAGEKA